MCPTVWFYLAEVYRLQDLHGGTKISALANAMDVSLQAASRMVRRMAEDGYVIHEPYQGITLTPKGEQIALRMIRRHRILEAFLVTVMAFRWDEVHEMVEVMEKGIDDRLVARMFEMAGQPERCPHGEPIPTAAGEMPAIQDQPLTTWPVSTEGVVSRVRTHDEEKLQYLAKVKLVPGMPLTVLEHVPFDGPVYVECNRDRFAVGNRLAQQIYIEAT